MKKDEFELSVVVPVYNEQGNLKILHQKLKKVLQKLEKTYEIIFIDDGSTDKSLQILRSTKGTKIIVFRKNFGQTAALAAGFNNAKGNIIVALDADLQNDPKDIPRLIAELEKGFDIVSGWRKQRKDNFLLRILPSMIANWFISSISGVKLHDHGCTLKAYKKEIIKSIKLYGEMHRFIPAIAASIGAKITEIEVSHHPRHTGKTNYGLDRTWRVILDVINIKFLHSYQTRPLHLFGGIGALISSIGIVTLIWLAYERLVLLQPLSSRPMFMVAITLLLVGIQLITIGLLAEFLTRIYYESQNKKIYYIKKIVN